MMLTAFLLLATLALVSLPTCSATDQQQQQQQAEQQCVSKAELDSVVTQMTAQTAAVESELNTWQNATLHILKTFLLDNPALLLETVRDKLENIQYKMEQQQDKTNRLLDELRNTTMDGHANLQDKVDTLQDNVDMLQDKVINLEDKLDTFQNTTEASTRKHHNEVVELVQNTSCSSEGVYTDCKDALNQGQTTSGVYTIKPDHQPEFQAYCDMDTDGGGWTVFQRREDGSVDFYRYWADYQQGFGDPSGEFWLGLDKIHRLTSNATQLRIDMQDFERHSRYAQYSSFSVGDSVSKYTLSVSGYSGTAGDSLTVGIHNQVHNGQKFTTRDQDNDIWPGNCAQQYKGGWWYAFCHESNLNGLYHGGSHSSYADGVNWYIWRGYRYSLKFTEMKLREN